MPRRLIQALLVLAVVASAAPAAASPHETGAPSAIAVTRYQEDPGANEGLAEDQFSGFTMPGLTPDNLTTAVLGDIDAFWSDELATQGKDYYPAGTIAVTEAVASSCGQFGPYDNPAAYCPLDDTVYYSVPLSQEIETAIGDFAWITVLAHEWGHHVQLVLGIDHDLTIDRELQADCFAGAYAQHALQKGFLQQGDVTEAVIMNIMSGDPVGMQEMADGAHGSSDYRVTSFMEGYLNGVPACLAP
jgi:predicted metalloprotease